MPAPSRPSASNRHSHSLAHAVEYLKKQEDLTVASALDSLTTLQRHLAVTTVYQQCFPGQYKRQLAKLKITQPWQISEQLLQSFTDLVSHKYFPVNNWDLEWVYDQFPSIPIPLENYDAESEFEHEDVAIQIAAAIAGCYSNVPDWTTIQERLGPTIVVPHCFLDAEHRCKTDVAAFTQLCQRHPEPVASFPHVIRILAHNTDSIFLDISYDYEMPEHGYEWTREDLLTLQQQWRAAKRLLRTLHRTVAKLKTHPQAWPVIFASWETMCRSHARTTA